MNHKNQSEADQLSATRLRELLDYSPETGIFTRRTRASQKPAGSVAGTRHRHGYVQIGIDGRLYLGHRLAWLWVHGSFPVGEIDHINGDKADNRIDNIRDVAHSTNMENIKKPRRSGTSGKLGAHKAKGGRWHAKIQVGGKSIYLGSFGTQEEAHDEYVRAKRRLHAGGAL